MYRAELEGNLSFCTSPPLSSRENQPLGQGSTLVVVLLVTLFGERSGSGKGGSLHTWACSWAYISPQMSLPPTQRAYGALLRGLRPGPHIIVIHLFILSGLEKI